MSPPRCYLFCSHALPWNVSSCSISSSTDSSFMTLDICPEGNRADSQCSSIFLKLHVKTYFEHLWQADLSKLQTERDRPLSGPVAPTERAVPGPLTAGRSTPPPSPPGRWWRPRSFSSGCLRSGGISPAAWTGCFLACRHSATEDMRNTGQPNV